MVAPSLIGLSWSLGLEAKPLAGFQGAEFLAAPIGLSHIKEQNFLSTFWVPSFLFLWIFFQVFF